MGVGFIWAVILGAGILAFPETPRFNYRKGKKDEAKEFMMKVYGAPANHYTIHVELEEIEYKLRAETAKGSALQEWCQMFSAPKVAYRVLLGMGLQMFQQLTGKENPWLVVVRTFFLAKSEHVDV
jgi:SP family sugar:H+ symporter-like MFS transporter